MLIVLFILVGSGLIGGVATIAYGVKLADSRAYDGVTMILIGGGVSVLAIAGFGSFSWLLPLGVSLILASCPWGLLGHRLFK